MTESTSQFSSETEVQKAEITTAIENSSHGEDRLKVLEHPNSSASTVILCDGATAKKDGAGGRAAEAVINYLGQALNDLQQSHGEDLEIFADNLVKEVVKASSVAQREGGQTTVSIVHSFGPIKENPSKHKFLVCATDDSPIIIYDPKSGRFRRYPAPPEKVLLKETLSDKTIYTEEMGGQTAYEWLDNSVEPPKNRQEEALNKSRRRIRNYLGGDRPPTPDVQWLNLPDTAVIFVGSDGITDVLPIETTEASKKRGIFSITELMAQGKDASQILEYAVKVAAQGKENYFRAKRDDRSCAVITMPKAKNFFGRAGKILRETFIRATKGVRTLATYSEIVASSPTATKKGETADNSPFQDIDTIIRTSGDVAEANRKILEIYERGTPGYEYWMRNTDKFSIGSKN